MAEERATEIERVILVLSDGTRCFYTGKVQLEHHPTARVVDIERSIHRLPPDCIFVAVKEETAGT